MAVVGLYAAFDTLDESGVGEPLFIAGMVAAGGVVGSLIKTERWERIPGPAVSARVLPCRRGVRVQVVLTFWGAAIDSPAEFSVRPTPPPGRRATRATRERQIPGVHDPLDIAAYTVGVSVPYLIDRWLQRETLKTAAKCFAPFTVS